MNKILSYISDIFFPNRCPVCNAFIEWNKCICPECEQSLKAFPENICKGCGKTECFCSEKTYDKAMACFYYEGKAKDGILSLKDGHKEFGIYIGKLLGNRFLEEDFKADAVIPVPMSKESYRKRRYNQAEVIGEQIAEINHIKLLNGILYKKNSAVQHSLNKAERTKNTSAFYSEKKFRLYDMNIILCDDVLTTGSTLNKCASLLKEIGAAEVYAAVGTTTKLKKE